jgi:hypothetical protein
MGFLERLERALQERLEPASLEHPYEVALALWRLLAAHPRPGGFCPNRLRSYLRLDGPILSELETHVRERGFRLAAPLHQVQGPLGVGYGIPGQAEARALVEVLDGPSAGKVARLTERLVVGRGEDAGLRLGDPSVSRRHCEVSGELQVRDLGSRQGIRVRGQQVDEARLEPGERFQVGAQQLRVFAVCSVGR